MPRYAAFLRAINVGGHVVKMDALRRMFESAGCSEVETVIASGNVIFSSASKSSDAVAAKLARHLEESLGYEVGTFVRTPAELAEAVNRNPFPDGEGYGVYVGFMAGPPAAAAVRKLRALETEIDEFRVVGRELYWLCRGHVGQSKFAAGLIEKTLAAPATMRKVTTVRKMAARCPC